MRITAVDGVVLRNAEFDVTRYDPAGEVLIVRVHTDSGHVGLAECNHAALPAHCIVASGATSLVDAGIRDVLVGREPLDRKALIEELFERNVFSLRRGLGLAVLHAVDNCLWDLVAQQRGEPLWRTLWGDAARPPMAYLTLYTGPGSFEESLERLETLVASGMALGYRAAKVEPLVDCVPEERIPEFVARGRELLGEDVDLYVDFGHRFRDAEHAAPWIEAIAEHRPLLIETPLHTDDVWEYARLGELVDVPLAASELYESPWEFRALLDVGRVGVVQPWPNRMGVTATLQVAELARERGRRCLLAGWNTTPIGVATGLHIAAGLGDGIVLEHAPVESYGFPLRAVATPEPQVEQGRLPLLDAPGLGVVLDEAAVQRYAA
jgi:L-alanine-DL-glutamate epimerase-like enolase superfamily enzyme